MNRRGFVLGLFGLAVAGSSFGSAAEAKGKRKVSSRRKGSGRSSRSRSSGGGGGYYSSCAEARAAGAAPIRAGQKWYRRKLDRDGDGVACE